MPSRTRPNAKPTPTYVQICVCWRGCFSAGAYRARAACARLRAGSNPGVGVGCRSLGSARRRRRRGAARGGRPLARSEPSSEPLRRARGRRPCARPSLSILSLRRSPCAPNPRRRTAAGAAGSTARCPGENPSGAAAPARRRWSWWRCRAKPSSDRGGRGRGAARAPARRAADARAAGRGRRDRDRRPAGAADRLGGRSLRAAFGRLRGLGPPGLGDLGDRHSEDGLGGAGVPRRLRRRGRGRNRRRRGARRLGALRARWPAT